MKVIILGGIGEAQCIAQALIKACHEVTYSIAGIVRQPDLDCRVLSGGFRVLGSTPGSTSGSIQGQKVFTNGAEGLYWHMQQEVYDLVIDATHPYAIQISSNAVIAAERSNIPLWRYLREPWIKSADDNWLELASLEEIISHIRCYHKPFFTIGREVFSKIDCRDPKQEWTIRSAGIQTTNDPAVVELIGLGPFKLEDELALFQSYGFDVLISKNSGGEAVAAKLEAARQLGIPVILLQRPIKQDAQRCFSSVQAILKEINRSFLSESR
ncbi:precorrin-6A/cobalt-precorrin-6A reductase [Beggiatoa alba]|nr:precorrin-6A/cobalt-precorrin-6A reductase [Beggiatoa alba]